MNLDTNTKEWYISNVDFLISQLVVENQLYFSVYPHNISLILGGWHNNLKNSFINLSIPTSPDNPHLPPWPVVNLNLCLLLVFSTYKISWNNLRTYFEVVELLRITWLPNNNLSGNNSSICGNFCWSVCRLICLFTTSFKKYAE